MKHINPMKYINTMKHIITISYRKSLICALTALLAWTGVQNSNAYYFRAGDRIYLNTYSRSSGDTEFDWGEGDAHLVMWIWKDGGDGEWLEFKTKEYEYNSHKVRIMSATITNAGDYKHCKLIRRPNTDWYHTDADDWGHTGNMDVKNVYIYRYWFNGVDGEWAHTLPDDLILAPYAQTRSDDLKNYNGMKAALAASGITAEEYAICPDAAGDVMSLHCKINPARTDYDESNVWQHAWYYTVDGGTTWESLDNYAGRIRNFDEGARSLSPILPDPLPDSICYYLYSKVTAGQRLIKFKKDATGCGYDCTITSAERAISNVNAETDEYTLDGLVAFGIPNGNLVIVYGEGTGDEKTETITSPVSPQSFSMTVPAALTDGVTRKLKAYFTGKAACTKDFTDVPVPNVRNAKIDHPVINLLTGTSQVMTPSDAENSNKAIWVDAKEVSHTSVPGAAKTFTTMPSDTAGTHTYIYKEYYPLDGSNEDMMSNGDYDVDGFDYGTVDGESTMSAYTYWGLFSNASAYSEFYTGSHASASNGFAVIQQAKNFHDKYASVTAKHGSFYGLFDAASDGVEGKKAWYAKTADNPKLKLKKGTTYVFSFWAANINNYGEMDNPAKLQFQIEYNGTTELLGAPLDLSDGEFHNNIWHQCSSTFTAPESCDDVTISVVNLNTDLLRVGNDFALDDIQFHAISTVTEVAKSYQTFTVVFHEPAISDFTATPVQMACGESSYAVDLHIEFKNQNGKIIVKDITDGGSKVVWDSTLLALPDPGASADWEETRIVNRRVTQTIGSSDPVGKTRTYKVYFEDWTSANLTDDFNDPVIPYLNATNNNNPAAILPCDQLTYTLTVDVSYRNMSSDKIRVWIDGASYDASLLKQEKTITTATSTIEPIKFAIDNVPADSAEHTLHVECAGLGEGCFTPVTFRAPFSPKIVEPITVTTPTLNCSSVDTYTAIVYVTTTNHRNATLTAKIGSATLSQVVTDDVTTFEFAGLPADGSTDNEVIVYFDYVHATLSTCEKSKTFTAPLLPKASLVTPITMPSVAACDQLTFDLTVSIKFTNQDGDLQVKVDDGSWKTFYTPSESAGEGKYIKNSAEQTKTVKLTGLPADGGKHKIYYRFYAEGYCGYDTPLESDELTFPQSPTITSTTVSSTPTAVACDATSYTRTVTVNYKNGNGKKIIIEDDKGNELYKSPTTLTSSNGTITPSVTLSAIDGASHYVIAYFEGYSCKSEPDHKGTYTAPVKPIISEVKVTTVGETKCTPYKYTISGTVKYSNADVSKNLIVAYGALTDEIDITSASATVDFTIADMTAVGSTLTVDAYFEDAPATCTKTSNPFASPTQPSMEIKNIKQSTPGCDDLTYEIEFDVEYIYQHGDMTVQVDALDPIDVPIAEVKRRKTDLQKEEKITYSGIPADGATHTLKVSFAGANSCSETQTLGTVLSPVITDLDVEVPTTPIACDAASYPATVTVDTKYATGKKIVVKYKNKSGVYEELATHVVASSPESYPFSLTFKDVGATIERSVLVYLSERDTCEKTKSYSIPPTTSIAPFTVGITDHSTCDGVLYDIEGDIEYTSKPADADPAVRFGTYSATVTNITSSKAHYKFTSVATTGEDLAVEAYFTNKPNCFVSSNEFASPLKPNVEAINQVMATPACNAPTTSLTFDVRYTKQPAGTLTVWLDDAPSEKHKEVDYTPNNGSETPTTIENITIADVPADGNEHTLHVQFSNGCSISPTVVSPLSPVIKSVKASSLDVIIHCNETYGLKVEVECENGGGKKLYIEGIDNDGNPMKKWVTATSDKTHYEFLFPNNLLNLDLYHGPIKAYFEGSTVCDVDKQQADYTLPEIIGVSLATVSVNPVTCGATTFSITGSITSNRNGQTVVVTTSDGHSKEVTSPTWPRSFTIDGLTASGTVTAQIKDVDCSRTEAKSYEVPAFKPTPTLTLNSIAAQCYPATSFEVTYDHTDADKLYYKVTQGTTTKIDWTEVTVDDAKKFTITTTGWAAGDYKVEAYAESAAGCKSATPYPTATLTINKKPSLELAAIADVCDGTSGVSTAVTLKDGAAKYDYDVFKNGVLMSDQHKSGQTAALISLTTSSWEPATYKIHVTAYSSANCPSEPKEVSFTINPRPVFETLTASQTICEGEDAVSYDFTITGAKTYSYSVVGTDIAETGITVPDGGSGTISFDPSVLSDGDYTLQVIAKSELGCTTTRNAALKINNKPTVSLTATTNICYGDPAGLDFNYTVSADAKNYYLYLRQADRSKSYGGCGNFDLPTMNEGTIHYDSFSPFVSPLSGGDYIAVMWVKNSAGCVSDSVVVPFTIYPIAGIEIYTVASMCVTKPLSTVFYNIYNAKSFRYKIEGVTEWSGPQTPSTEDLKHFEFNISSLDPDNYTLQLQAYNDNCGYSNIVESPFTIYPLPTLDLDVPATGVNVCYPVSQVDIPYTSTDAKKYTYELTVGSDKRTATKSASSSGKIEVDTDGLPAGDYALSVTAVSEHDCEIAAAQTTTIHINPRPTFTFKEGEVRDCHPSTSINVGYTSKNAKTYSYTLTKEGAGSASRTETNQQASDEGTIVLNTKDLAAGTYDLEVTAKSEHDCDMLASVSRKVIIQAKPTVTINSVENHCAGNANISVSYSTTDATTYYYEVLGTGLQSHADAEATGSFTIDISSLEPDTYTLRMKATAGQCESATDDEEFVIYPIPEVGFVTPAPIKEGVANVTVKLNLTDATKYDWRFIDKDGSTELESGNNVPVSQTTITLTTGALEEGIYTLYVTPHSATCDGVENDVHVVVNNKPIVNFSDADLVVCAGTETLNVEFSTSPDAVKLTYSIKQGTTTVVGEQTIDDLATHPSPLALNVQNLPYGTYTLCGYVASTLENGDESTKDFIILAQPEIVSVTQDKEFIGCGETYDATVTVNIFNAAGRKIYAKYTDDGEHTPHKETSAGDPTATINLTGLTHTDLNGKHEVKVYVDGFEDCGITVGYDEPKLMIINQLTADCKPKSCNANNDTVCGTVSTDCNIGTIRVEYVGDATIYDDIDLTTTDRTYQLIIPAGGTPKVKAYFLSKTCEPLEQSYTPTTMPEANITATVPVTLPCDVTTFDLPFTLDYTYQEEGTLTVWVDNDHKNTYSSADNKYEVLAAGTQLTGTIEDLPADGRTGQKLYFEFSGSHSCKGSIDLADFPNTPVIDSVKVVKDKEYIEGLTAPYYPTVTVYYKRAKGQTIMLEYFDKENNSKYAESPEIDSDEEGSYIFDKTTVADWSFDDATMGERVVHAYFKGSQFNNCHEGGAHDGHYTAPTNCSIKFESIDPLINRSTCDHLSYDLTGKVSFVGVARGDLIVELTLDGKTFSGKIDHVLCVPDTELPFEIKNITKPIPDDGTQLTAYFLDLKTNTTILDYNVSTPVIPTVKVENPTYSTPQCNESVVSLTFDLKYTRQQGNLYLSWDNQQCVYEILTGEPLMFSDDTLKATIVIKNITADQKEHRLWVAFGGTNCSDEVLIPAAPYSPKVTSHKAEITNIACDKDTYTLNVSFTVENSLGKDATLLFRGESVNVSTTDGTNYSHSFNNVARTYGDVTDDVVELSFAGNDADCSGALYSIAYTETPKPAISLTLAADQGTTTCSDRTYRLQGEIRYTYLDQTPEIWLDEEAHHAIPVQSMQADEQVINLADLINVPADGREHHVYIKPNGWADACSIDVPFNALQQPIITAAEVSGVPAFISCGETYPATVTVDYVHAFGKTITVACTDNGSIQTYTSAAITDNDGQTVITLPSLSDHDGVTALSIYVDDETCAYTSASITQPKLNTIEPDFAVNVSTTPCGVVDYAVWGTVTFNNAVGLGELIVKTEDGVQADVTIKTATSAEFRIEHYTVAGTAMQLTAYFENAATCFVLSAPFDSPDVPDLTLDGTAVDTVFTCGDKGYTVRVAFTPTNQSGTGYVLDSIANGAVLTVETISVSATAAQFVIARPAKEEQHFVVVRYPATGCEEISQALDINPYTKPKPLISLTAIDRLCNNETELILPLVITQGDIDEATLTLTNSKGEKVITAADMSINVAHDTLSYNLPAQLAAGKYTATVDARDTLGCETSATQSVEFAIDGVVFSKWTDVLLVDNEDGLFTGYQWYENDKQLEGKTDQVLYLPEGMSGKSYYCVLQTAEGAIYTCVSDFGDLPRSADNPKTQSANHITVLPNRVATNGAVTVHQSLDENLHLFLMSATGKRVAEYNQTDATKLIDMPGVQGIYLLRIESDSDVQTVKIVVY